MSTPNNTQVPWREYVLEYVAAQDNRRTLVIYLENGEVPSMDFLTSEDLAFEMPAVCRNVKSIMHAAFEAPTHKAYILYMPNMITTHQHDFYAGVNCLKDGHLMNSRWEKRLIDRPQIVVFTSTAVPDTDENGRWEILRLKGDALVRY